MKDPHHITSKTNGDCTRCGLTPGRGDNGTYCPVGFWADRKQHAELDARPADPVEGRKVMYALEKKWLAEWQAAHGREGARS